MKVTKELLKELYEEYNQTYFDGVLGKCEFSLYPKSTGFLGSYRDRYDRNGKPKDRIWIGTCVKWNEPLLREVLIHEMIHMYNRRIDGRKRDGLLGHGRYFRKQVRRIRKQFGIDVDDRFKEIEYLNPKFQPKRWELILSWIIDR